MNRPRQSVLVVDADQESRRSIIAALEEAGISGAEATTFADALARLEGFAYDGLIVDVRVAGGDGLDVLDAALTRYPRMRCVVTAAFGSIHHAVRALKGGAIDYFLKPIATTQLVNVMTTALAAAVQEEAPVARVRETATPSFSGIVGRSPAMLHLFQTLERVAPMQSTVLIQGETGTGKELVARTIHQNSTRRDHPFVAFNAAAIPENLAEAELFGHVKGAFTGAVYARVGRFEAADRGTLFIDEVPSMSLGLQAKLLRALQEREIERVGTSRPLKINTRVIAATNRDLAEMVREGTFREDLYYRLNVIRVALPPLRARPEDVVELAKFFVDESCRMNDIAPKTLAQSTLQALMNHTWPGNVRHLQNAIENAVVMSGPDREIQPSALPEEILQPVVIAAVPERAPTVMPAMPEEGINFVSAMSQVERELILTYLKRAGGNKRQAARMLSLSRTTLIDKLVRLGVSEPRISVVERRRSRGIGRDGRESLESMESMEMETIEAVA
jgi:DNA-binding NtrC family response regulator